MEGIGETYSPEMGLAAEVTMKIGRKVSWNFILKVEYELASIVLRFLCLEEG